MFDKKERSTLLKSNSNGTLETGVNPISDRLGLIINLAGAFCALIGLVELIRLISFYWETYGLLANFPLEISIYAVGIGWIFLSLVSFLTSDNRFLDGLR